jgi:hypothetical protein
MNPSMNPTPDEREQFEREAIDNDPAQPATLRVPKPEGQTGFEPLTGEPAAVVLRTTRTPSPIELIDAAIQKGLDPQKILDWHERIEKARAQAAYAVAMNACQNELPVILHDAENSFLKSTYASLEGIQDRIKRVYIKHGFSLSWGEAESPRPGFVRIVCAVMHAAGHTERFQGDYPLDGKGAQGGANMNALQGRVSSNTYAQRDMLRSIFNLTIAGKDHDGNEYVTPDEIAALNELIGKTGTDLKRFLAWAGAETLDKLPRRRFAEAVSMLGRKVGK